MRAANPEDIARLVQHMLGGDGATPVTDDTAMRVGTVYACVRILSESVGLLPLKLYRFEGETEIPEPKHPVARLMRLKPNRWQTAFDYKRTMMVHLTLAGNHYALIRRLGDEVKELIPLNPRAMTVTQDDSLNLVYTYQRGNGTREQFKASDILHIRALSTDGLVGLSVISAAARAIGLALDTEKHGARMFRNAASPGGVLKHPGTLSEEAAKRLRESFDDQFAGAANAGKTILLEEGMEWSKVGMTADEAQFLETRKFQRSDIGMFFGVPPHMYGDIERGTSWGSGIEQQGVGFVTYTLLPWLTNITQAIDASLLTEREQERFSMGFDTQPLTKAEFVKRQQGLEIMRRNGVLSPNEWRRFEGLPPREDGGDDFATAGGSSGAVAGNGAGVKNDDEGQDEPAAQQAA